jgi:hypothetical protein
VPVADRSRVAHFDASAGYRWMKRTQTDLAIALGLLVLPAIALADDAPADLEVVQKLLAGPALSEKDLVPRGFLRNGAAKGDLDGDGVEDLALIIHRDHRKLSHGHGGDAPEVLAQLVLLFRGDKSGKFTLWKSGDTHFADWVLSYSDDDNEVGLFEIKKGVLSIGSPLPLGGGSWTSQSCTVKWRNGPAGFQLIGLTVDENDRRCACGSSTDTNLLTGLELYRTDRDDDGNQTKKERVVKKRRKRRTVLWDEFEWDESCK